MSDPKKVEKKEQVSRLEPPKLCVNCAHFFRSRGYRGDGLCRRYPPAYTGRDELSQFPSVMEGDGCGEFTGK